MPASMKATSRKSSAAISCGFWAKFGAANALAEGSIMSLITKYFRRGLATVCGAVIGASLLAVSPAVEASPDFPAKPIRLIVAYPPGGSTDITARIVAERMGALLGTSVVVENLGGASGTIGAAKVARTTPDGYELLFGSSPELTITRFTNKGLPYDSLKDFTPLTLIAKVPYVLTVRDSLPAKTLSEFIALAKEQQGKLTFASTGVNTTAHLISEVLKRDADIDFLQVPYKGSGPGMMDLQAGHVDFTIDTLTASMVAAQSGRVRILAIATPERSEIAPEIPTFDESGMPDFVRGTWFGILAPAATPDAVKEKIAKAAREVMASEDVRETLRKRGVMAAGGPPQEFVDLINSEIEGWSFLGKQ
ncbi:tripartite tricarboxylate transporter substrate binding protein [Bordetella sp. 15P40C-2]|nr:tripartite tricarboxylate transporter substrate binding protein [Bordetella sp. 15P40C-2]